MCIQISILAGCKVESEWCFGRCGAGPNVLVVKDGQDSFMTDVRTLEETSAAVEQATGRLPVLDAALASSLRRMRVVHAFEQELARAEMLAHCSTCTADDVQRNRQLDNAVSIVDKVIGGAGNAHPLLQAQHLKRSMLALRLDPTGDLDCTWQRVACWQLDAVEPRSEWSSVFRFSSSDAARGGRGGGSGAAARGGSGNDGGGISSGARTWHVTLRAELDGRRGDDGGAEGGTDGAEPEVVLRDYTPLSSEEELDNGVLRLLVKIYRNGKVTSTDPRRMPCPAPSHKSRLPRGRRRRNTSKRRR